MINFLSTSAFHLRIYVYFLIGFVPFSTHEKGWPMQAVRKAWVASGHCAPSLEAMRLMIHGIPKSCY
jgi:hypothetical protein